jgi:hypothetical protein
MYLLYKNEYRIFKPVEIIIRKGLRLPEWLKWWNACLASMRTRVQTQIPPKKPKRD